MSQSPKHVLTIEEALIVATDMIQKGVVPFFVQQALLNDNFSAKQAETIMRWAYLKVQREKAE